MKPDKLNKLYRGRENQITKSAAPDIVVNCNMFGFATVKQFIYLQRYFTRRVLFRTKLSYMERLQILNLELLEARRIKSDLKLCFKIINGLCDFDVDAFFEFPPPPKPLKPEDTIKNSSNQSVKQQLAIELFLVELLTFGTLCLLSWWMLNLWIILLQNLKNTTYQWFARAVGPMGVSFETCSASFISIFSN